MKFTTLKSLLMLAAFAVPPITACSETELSLPDIAMPGGFSMEVFADNVPNARSMALGDDGTVYVSTRSDGRVYAIRQNNDGTTRVVILAENLKTPNGIEFFNGDLYVAETRRLLRFVDIENQSADRPEYEVVDESFPTERHHGWRYIKAGPDGKLYMSIGAPCNVCDREGFGIIQRMDMDGSNKETFASGVRNSVGLAFHPSTDELWFTDNGRDMLGDNVPAGELNVAVDSGLHFGFPFCHGGDVADPDFGSERSCEQFEAPAQKLGAHVAPLGLLFYDGTMFPEEYRGAVLIAEHGSWNRSQKTGYRISMVRMQNGSPLGYEVFAEGWMQNEQVSGRPVDLLVLDDGSVLVSDDHAGRIYRITYTLPLLDQPASAVRLTR